jgi:hypothetical protein
MKAETYKGYRVELQRTNKWITIISRPGMRKFINGTPRATFVEGEEIARKRAHEFIDEEETKAKEVEPQTDPAE